MLLTFGRVPPSEPWRLLEVAMNQSPDSLALRLSLQLKKLREPSEVLIPYTPNAAGCSEWIVEHIYVRGLNGSLARIARTPGIERTRKDPVPPEWIFHLKSLEDQPRQIEVGSYVRLLAGPCSRMCGEVVALEPPKVTVAIEMPTKTVRVHTTIPRVQKINQLSSFFA
jgi:hypothetical protein